MSYDSPLVPVSVFEAMRCRGYGVPYVILPDTGAIRYLLKDLDDYLARGRVASPKNGPTAEQRKHKRPGGPGRPPGPKAKLRRRAKTA